MSPTLDVRWLGRRAYADVHAEMATLLDARIAGDAPDTLLLVEHDPVFTLGRRRGAANNVLAAGDAPVIQVERGGDVTFHGPGQLVGYPICTLPPHRQDLMAWLRGLEAVCTDVIGHWGVRGEHDDRNTGVWVDGQKIAAIGVSLRRWTSWHGFAINVDVDIDWFKRINPCGMQSDLVTRLADHVRPTPSMEAVRDQAAARFETWWMRWAASP